MSRGAHGVRRLLIAASLAVASAAQAHDDPPGCSSTGAALMVSAFRGSGPVGLSGPASECEQISYKLTLQTADPAACAFSGGVLTLTTPDGVVHTISDDLPCIGAAPEKPSGPKVIRLL